MARFYGSMNGSARTAATRCGGASGGVSAHVRGWRVGVRVDVVDVDGRDVVRVYRTTGSAGTGPDVFIAEWQEEGEHVR